MPLVTTKKMFEDAYKGGYAIGAFNVNNMEIIQGITEAAKKLNAPLILQVSKGARAYANHTYLVKLVEAADGYGHGVGLSQTGANALAAQGKSFAEILANYYYGAILVSGDTYPEKINYKGTDYSTRDFLAGTLYAEMGDSFNHEALKAQAIAIYTFAKYYQYKVGESGVAYKPGASQKMYSVVDEIIKNGFYIAANAQGETALTPFHATSAGKTTSYRNVWGSETDGVELTYLAGGRPSPDESSVKDFKTVVTITSDEFKSLAESSEAFQKLAKEKGANISFSGDPSTWISIISHDTAINESIGYVSSINVGGVIISGNDFRSKIMNTNPYVLRSHCFTVVYTPSAS